LNPQTRHPLADPDIFGVIVGGLSPEKLGMMPNKKAQPAAAPEFHLHLKYGTLRRENGTWDRTLFSYWNEVGSGNWRVKGT